MVWVKLDHWSCPCPPEKGFRELLPDGLVVSGCWKRALGGGKVEAAVLGRRLLHGGRGSGQLNSRRVFERIGHFTFRTASGRPAQVRTGPALLVPVLG